MSLETLVYSSFNHLMKLLPRKYFIEFSRHEALNKKLLKQCRFMREISLAPNLR